MARYSKCRTAGHEPAITERVCNVNIEGQYNQRITYDREVKVVCGSCNKVLYKKTTTQKILIVDISEGLK